MPSNCFSLPRGAALRRSALSLCAALSLAASATAGTLFVDRDAGGANDGSSWANAYTTLGAALTGATSGDQVWVADGTYIPVPGDATAAFEVPDGVTLYGGFAGGETALTQRDPDLNVALLSGDVDGDDLVVGSSWTQIGGNAGHVLDTSGASGVLIDGFTMSYGSIGPQGTLAGNPLMFGGGVYNIGGSLVLRDCTFRHNRAAFASGGAVFSADGDLTVDDCLFEFNSAGQSSNGGALATDGAGAVLVQDSLFRENLVTHFTSSPAGGGMAHRGSVPATVLRCRFIDNVSHTGSQQSGTSTGGGLHVFLGGAEIVDCEFRGNTANYGGGLDIRGPTTVVNCLIVDNTAVTHPNDPIGGTGGYGAGLRVFSFSTITVSVVNSTIAYNNGRKYAGAWISAGSTSTVTADFSNTIIWGNVASHPEISGGWKAQLASTGNGDFNLDHCCVRDIFDPHAPGEDPIDPGNLPGCIDLDPLFEVTPGAERLTAGSPCIDAGLNATVPAGVSTDLDGNARLFDDPDTADTGTGSAPLVDMGPYEFTGSHFTDLRGGVAGGAGLPTLAGTGSLVAGTQVDLVLTGGLPFGTSTMVVGLSELGAPFKGGTLWPNPDFLVRGPPLDGAGSRTISFAWPAGVPSGFVTTLQEWMADGAAVLGWSASNGLRATTP